MFMLLDEPFGALDELTKRRLQEELKRILKNSKTTAVMLTIYTEKKFFLSVARSSCNQIMLLIEPSRTTIKAYAFLHSACYLQHKTDTDR